MLLEGGGGGGGGGGARTVGVNRSFVIINELCLLLMLFYFQHYCLLEPCWNLRLTRGEAAARTKHVSFQLMTDLKHLCPYGPTPILDLPMKHGTIRNK